MKGILYGVGVGPGDPDLMTLKAVRLIEQNEVIAFPGKEARQSTAYRIAAAAVPGIGSKQPVPVYMPMSRDRMQLEAEHRRGACLLETFLDRGENVVFLTLGDPAVYSTFYYLQKIVQKDGYETAMVSGVPSFCAAAARLNQPLVIGEETLHVVPDVQSLWQQALPGGTMVLMKSAGHLREVRELFGQSRRSIQAVENCGMEGERVFQSAEALPDEAGYYLLVVAKETERMERPEEEKRHTEDGV